MPPVGVKSIAPLLPPKQFTFAVTAVALTAEAGCVIVDVAVAEQPLLSVTVRL